MKRVDKEEIITPEKPTIKKSEGSTKRLCPYLGTVRRRALDFDFEKVCSVSLQTTNVYACLVCGKYFQGRGKGSCAFIHSVQFDHHVFLNLHTKKILLFTG